MPKYTVIDGPLDHDGKRHDNGDVLDLDAKVGDRLEGDGIVAKGKVKLPSEGDGTEATGGDAQA